MHQVIQAVHQFLTEWPQTTRYTIISIGLGLSGLLFNLDRLRRTMKEGQIRQQAALEELKGRIIDRTKDRKLLTGSSVRSLALGMEKRHRCPVITDLMIAEAVRAAALELEDRCDASDLVTRLKPLNKLLKELKANDPGLLSLAILDRLPEFKKVHRGLVKALFYLVVVSALLQMFVRIMFIPSVVFLIVEVLIVLFPLQSPLLTSHRRWVKFFWTTLWSPFTEDLSKFYPQEFVLIHEFRIYPAVELSKQLLHVWDEAGVNPGKGEPSKPPDCERFVELCRQLWVITGQEHFREMEQRRALCNDKWCIFRFLLAFESLGPLALTSRLNAIGAEKSRN
jgi:hypothetical protein